MRITPESSKARVNTAEPTPIGPNAGKTETEPREIYTCQERSKQQVQRQQQVQCQPGAHTRVCQ
eukprot:4570389-Amphidinium_carterae.1